MLINNVKIENFKRFDTFDAELFPLDCLVGANNSGKTTLLQALALFDFCVRNCLSRKNGSERIELKTGSIPPEEFDVFPLADPRHLWTDYKRQSQHNRYPIKITLSFEEGTKVIATIRWEYNRYAIQLVSENQSQEWLEQLSHFRISYLPVFSTFLPQEERRTRAVIEDELARGRVNSVIRNLLLDLKDQKRHAELIGILQRSFPDLTKVAIQFDEINDRYISVTYKEKQRPKEFDLFSSGSGFQQFIYLFGYILLRQPTVILLDEPDVHLHGSLQGALLNELRRLVDSGKQVIFATHSSDLIKQMPPENILTLSEEGAKRLAIAFDVYDALDELGSVEITQLPVIQAYRRVLVVEDESDWELLAIFFSKILSDPTVSRDPSVWQQVERRLAICYAKGNPWKQDMERLRQQLQNMIAIKGRPLEMFVVADRDYHPNLQDLYHSRRSQHIQWHIWERVEIENYLLTAEGIRRLLLGEHQAQASHYNVPLQEEFDRLVELSRDSANDKLGNVLRELNRGWEYSTISREVRKYLEEHWEKEKLALADAKIIVLPKIKQWAEKQGLKQFSEKALANNLRPEDLPDEVHQVARRIASFAGVPVDSGS